MADHQARAPRPVEPPTRALTERERQVLEFQAAGHTAKAIARLLHVTETTVRSHLRAIQQVLGASSAVASVDRAWRAGILTADPAGADRSAPTAEPPAPRRPASALRTTTTTVRITAGEVVVTHDGPGDLDDVVGQTLRIWHATRTADAPDKPASGPGHVGFAATSTVPAAAGPVRFANGRTPPVRATAAHTPDLHALRRP